MGPTLSWYQTISFAKLSSLKLISIYIDIRTCSNSPLLFNPFICYIIWDSASNFNMFLQIIFNNPFKIPNDFIADWNASFHFDNNHFMMMIACQLSPNAVEPYCMPNVLPATRPHPCLSYLSTGGSRSLS